MAKRADGSPRHLFVNEGNSLHEILEGHLAAIGYTGPASAGEH